MSDTNITPFTIMPLCIYHYNDKGTNTYRGFINIASKIRTKGGNEILKCVQSQNRFGSGWKYYGSFYALSPMLRPIPSD